MDTNFFQKRLKDIEFSDIENLVKNQVPESFDLDYKEDYPSNKNLAKLMIGLSNASGGYIIIGVKCKQDTNIPEVITGIERREHSTKITQIAYSNSQPHICPKIQVFPHENIPEKDVVIIKMNEAIEPIMLIQGNKFPIRINDKVEYADQSLVKKLFSKRNIFNKIEEIKTQMTSLEEEKFFNVTNIDPGKRYILIRFYIIPFHRGGAILNFNDREIESFIKNLRKKLSYQLFEKLPSFDNFLQNFYYMGNHYLAEFIRNLKNNKVNSEFRIYQDGRIHCFIIYLARKGLELLESSHKSYDVAIVNEATAKHSGFLYYRNILVLIILFLRLAQLIYSNRFSGKIYTSLRCLISQYQIFISLNDSYYDYSHKNDINIIKTFSLYDFNDKQNLKKHINEFLKEFLRYFFSDLHIVKKKLKGFQELIDEYINAIFSFKV